MVVLAWLLDLRKTIRRNGLASQLSYLVDPYLIELSVFIEMIDRLRQRKSQLLETKRCSSFESSL
ncbi:hypothetical protein Lser_V15G07133 [Lactuca serriola]